jgi:glyoxylase-like metal-dependent hydrolase (beta-lactamase superfamily II)
VTLALEVVEPEVVRIRMGSWQGRLFGYEVSAYLLRGVLVDTGFPRVSARFAMAVDTLRPRGAIVTHWHEDHAGSVPLLASRELPMRLHGQCEATLREHPPIGFYRRVVWGQAPRLTAPIREFDASPLQVLALPGHTEDHLVAWDPEQRILASGDLFLGVKVRVAHESESPRRLLESLRAAAALEPRLLLDAHRGPVYDATARLRAKIAWLDETIGAIAERAARGDAPGAITRRVLGSEPMVGYLSAGEYSMQALVRAVLAGR